MEPTFFETEKDFRVWLQKRYLTEKELLVGFYKKGSGRASMTWPESVDQALCFGWIDGVRKSIDEVSYSIRFTPRKPGSIWSAVNIDKIEKLIAAQLVTPEGLAAFEKRTESKSRVYSHERTEDAVLPDVLLKAFKAEQQAWHFFEAQPPGYKKVALHWVTSAKQEATIKRRFEKLLEACKQQKRLQ